jgi:hypothetical protein
VDAALRKAGDYLASVEPNPHLYMFLDVFHRRFGVSRFRDSRSRYIKLMELAHPETLPYLRALRRVVDPGHTEKAEDADVCVPDVDRITCPAIHCDRLPAPPGYERMLREDLAEGRYGVTHVGLAVMAARDLECRGLVPADVESAAVESMKKIVVRDGRVTDLELEAATILTYLGHGEHVPSGFAEDVLASQRPKGGWALDSEARGQRADWHPTCFAVWYLLESRPAHGARAPMVPRD